MEPAALAFRDADAAMRSRLVAKLNVPGRHRLREQTLHLDDGFTVVAVDGDEPVAVISVCWRPLPVPDTTEAYIDLLDVDPDYRRRGLARQLVERATARAAAAGAYQLRAWSSEERTAAIALWRSLGFALCPTEILAGSQRVRGCFATKRLGGDEATR